MSSGTTPGLPQTTLGADTHRILVRACRLAAKRGGSEVGAFDLLLALLRSAPNLGGVVGHPPSTAAEEVVSPLALAKAAVSEVEVLIALRQSRWEVFGGRRGRDSDAPNWDAEASTVVQQAVRIARAEGLSWAGQRHLFAALLADPNGTAWKLLSSRSVDMGLLAEAVRRTWPDSRDEHPLSEIADFLSYWSILIPAKDVRPTSRARWVSRYVRIAAEASVVLMVLEREAIVECVRLGHSRVAPFHLVLAIVRFEEQVLSSGRRLAPDFAVASEPILVPHGANYLGMVAAATRFIPDGPIARRKLRRPWGSRQGHLSWTVQAATAAERVRESVGGQHVGSLHLLREAIRVGDDSVLSLLGLFDLDKESVFTEISKWIRV